MDLVKLSALKDEKFTNAIVGAAALIALGLGWNVFDPEKIYYAILGVFTIVTGLNITGRIADIKKKTDGEVK